MDEYDSLESRKPWLRKLLLAVPLLFACFCFWRALPDRVTSPQSAQAIAPSQPQRHLETVPIKEIRLEQRTIGRNPDRYDTHPNQPEPNQATWREIHLEIAKSDGSLLQVELLRSLDWLNYHEATTGGVIYLDLPEMGAQGFANVVEILSCPEIEPDTGEHRNVVTGRFIHNSSGNLIDLLVEGETEPTGVTDNHRYWSEDRQDFVEAGKLKIGEHLRLADGTTAELAGMTRRPRDEPVYNLVIHGEHVYHVGFSGVLVHNSYATNRTTRVTSWAGGGATPDLQPGRWVVKGEATKWNFFKTGLWGPKTSKKFPFIKKAERPFTPISGDIPTENLVPPKTSLKEPFAIIKRLFGQYKIGE